MAPRRPPPTGPSDPPRSALQAPRNPPPDQPCRPPAPHPSSDSRAVESDKPNAIGISGVLNTVLMFSLLAPFIYRGPIEKSVVIYDTYSTLGGLVNSAAWLLYSVEVLKRDNCLDLVILNVASYVSGFGHLLSVYKQSKSNVKANVLIVCTAVVFGFVFILLQIDLEKAPILETVLGSVSLFATAGFLTIQLTIQLMNGIRKVHVMGLLCSVLPNIAMSIWTLAYTLLYHHHRTVIVVSSAINCGFQLLDLILMTVAHRKAILSWFSQMAQIIRERITGGHKVVVLEQISVRNLRRVNSAPAVLWMVREVEVPAPPADLAAETDIDVQRVGGNQGLGDLVIAILQRIRGIQRTGPTDEEVGRAQPIAQAKVTQKFLLLIWINQVWLKLLNSRFAGSVANVHTGGSVDAVPRQEEM